MSVSVGFAAHFVDLLDWLGIHLSPMWLSPAYFRWAKQTSPATSSTNPAGTRLHVPASYIVILLPSPRPRIRESDAPTHHGAHQDRRHIVFVVIGVHFIHPSNYHPFSPNGWSGVLAGGSIIFFTTSASTPLYRQRRVPRRSAHVPIGIIATPHRLYHPVHRVALVLHRHRAVKSVIGRRRAVVNALKRLTISSTARCCTGHASSCCSAPSSAWCRLSSSSSSDRPAYGSPCRATACCRHVLARPQTLPHTGHRHMDRGHPRRHPPPPLDVGTLSETLEHRHAVAFVLVSIGVLILRKKQPERHRGFRVPAAPSSRSSAWSLASS